MPIPQDILDCLRADDQTLTELNFSRCYPDLTVADMRSLANALRGNHYITKLILCEDGIEDEGICILAEALPAVPSLIELDVSVNNIGDTGATALFSVTTLKCLDVAANSVTDRAAEQLLHNTTLYYVHLDGNSVSPALVAQIDVQLEGNEQKEATQLREEFHRFIESLSSPNELELALSVAKESIQAHAGKEAVPVMQ